MMKYIPIEMKCLLHPGASYTVYILNVDEKIQPNGCNQYQNRKICDDCCARALDILISRSLEADPLSDLLQS